MIVDVLVKKIETLERGLREVLELFDIEGDKAFVETDEGMARVPEETYYTLVGAEQLLNATDMNEEEIDEIEEDDDLRSLSCGYDVCEM